MPDRDTDVAQADRAAREAQHAEVSKDVTTVVDHLRNNRTTESEARTLQETARKSLIDHATAKSIQRD